MTRFATSFALVLVLLPCPVAGQKALFVEGLTELARAMMTLSENRAQVNAAIDKMSAGLDGSGPQAAPLPDASVLGDEAAAIPVLPLAAYAEGFARLRRGEYREAIASLRRAAATATDERSPLVAAGLLAQEGRHLEDAERVLLTRLSRRGRNRLSPAGGSGRVYETSTGSPRRGASRQGRLPVALTGRASIYASIGRLSRAEGDFAARPDAFERRLRLAPNDPLAHKHLARVYLDQDRSEAALVELAAALAIDPRDAEAYAAIGRSTSMPAAPPRRSRALRRALDLMPEQHETRYALALALKQAGHAEEAARELELFERARRTAVEDRRRTIAADVERRKRPGRARDDDAPPGRARRHAGI